MTCHLGEYPRAEDHPTTAITHQGDHYVAEPVGELIARRRTELGLSLQALATALRMSKSNLSRIELADALWPMTIPVEQLAHVLQLPADHSWDLRI